MKERNLYISPSFPLTSSVQAVERDGPYGSYGLGTFYVNLKEADKRLVAQSMSETARCVLECLSIWVSLCLVFPISLIFFFYLNTCSSFSFCMSVSLCSFLHLCLNYFSPLLLSDFLFLSSSVIFSISLYLSIYLFIYLLVSLAFLLLSVYPVEISNWTAN